MKSQDYPFLMADSLLDVLTKGGHSRALRELETVREDLCPVKSWFWHTSCKAEES